MRGLWSGQHHRLGILPQGNQARDVNGRRILAAALQSDQLHRLAILLQKIRARDVNGRRTPAATPGELTPTPEAALPRLC